MSTAAYEALVVAADAAANAIRLYNSDPVSFADLAAIAAEDLKIAYAAYKVHIEANATEPEPKRRC